MEEVKLTNKQTSALDVNPCLCDSTFLIMVSDVLTPRNKVHYWVECCSCGRVGLPAQNVNEALKLWIEEVSET